MLFGWFFVGVKTQHTELKCMQCTQNNIFIENLLKFHEILAINNNNTTQMQSLTSSFLITQTRLYCDRSSQSWCQICDRVLYDINSSLARTLFVVMVHGTVAMAAVLFSSMKRKHKPSKNRIRNLASKHRERGNIKE